MVFHFKTTKKSQKIFHVCRETVSHEKWWIFPYFPMKNGGSVHIFPWKMVDLSIFSHENGGSFHIFPWKMVNLSIFSHGKWWICPYFPMKNCGSFHIFPWKIVDLSIFSRNWWEKLMKSNDNMHKQVGKTLENWRKTVMINWRNRFGKLGTADETKW